MRTTILPPAWLMVQRISAPCPTPYRRPACCWWAVKEKNRAHGEKDMEFKGPLTGAPQTAILYGDPTRPGVFVTRVKFSAGWKDPPHWHPDEVRTVAVLSGTFYFASGEKWDESKFKPYPAGTFYSEPSKAPHSTWAKDGEVIIQVTGIGPSGKTFIPQ
jgi:quercetin dioxygenase-like cupin family protein